MLLCQKVCKNKYTLYVNALFFFLLPTDNTIGWIAHATAMKTIHLCCWCNFFLLDQKSACFYIWRWKQILWYLIDLLFVNLFCCDAKQHSFFVVVLFLPKQQLVGGGWGERNRKTERSRWEFRAERCLSSALGEQERAIEVRREENNSQNKAGWGSLQMDTDPKDPPPSDVFVCQHIHTHTHTYSGTHTHCNLEPCAFPV